MTENERCCQNCRFYFGGDCRRFPPQVGFDSGDVFATFPYVLKNEWCGEFQKIEKYVIPDIFVDPHTKDEGENG
jgi:hypothetical protein